jgi:hypothetical protein
MKRFVEGTDRGQSTLFPAVLDECVGEDNPVRAIDVFVMGWIWPSSASTALCPSQRADRLITLQRC